MAVSKLLSLSFLILLVSAPTLSISNAKPSDAASNWTRKGRESGLPVPRFVSLKADRARMRIGPAFEYAIEWLYQAPGLPLEIIEEYGHWRQVRDCDGITGWMHRSLLSSTRTAMVGPWLQSMEPLRGRPRKGASVTAKLEPRVRVQVLTCSRAWCRVFTQRGGVAGYIQKSSLWGVYPQETID
ncbi:SH3 domain-containing protein [Ensifer sp. NPDC090286]|uniref:SH3 domain-containing protein n=1 Tax=Ensifer sp. NPDC090286 TaxID=3363991 RepID=UPI00383B2ADA